MPCFVCEVNSYNKLMSIQSLSLKFLISLCFLALVGCGHQPPTEVAYQSLKLFPKGKSFSGFQLTSHRQNSWQAEQFKGNYSVVFFGFANCPDICPTTLLDMQKVDKVKQLSLSKMLAEAIRRLSNEESISAMFEY